MRGDLFSDDESKRLGEGERRLREAAESGDASRMQAAGEQLCRTMGALMPARAFSSFRENWEILVVAVGVAMAFRTYFLQPFKIPTGSMEPTLYGIHSTDDGERRLLDHFPLNLAQWIVNGQMFHEIRARESGHLSPPQSAGEQNPASVYYFVGSRRYKLPRDARPRFMPGDYVAQGAVIWSGVVTAGDHVFVNRMAWNFRLPRRGEIMVFSTDGIRGLQQGTHYIKRMAGTPGETIQIHPPNLIVNGIAVTNPPALKRIVDCTPGYAGYQLPYGAEVLGRPSDSITLGSDQYFALGDNTRNSRDGRYWGPVPRTNLVGPAGVIYWPISRRWGLLD